MEGRHQRTFTANYEALLAVPRGRGFAQGVTEVYCLGRRGRPTDPIRASASIWSWIVANRVALLGNHEAGVHVRNVGFNRAAQRALLWTAPSKLELSGEFGGFRASAGRWEFS